MRCWATWAARCSGRPAREKTAENSSDPTRGLSLLTLSVATSIDALAVGMSMAFLGVSVWLPSVVIGVVTATLTAVGIIFGGRIGSRWGRWAEVAGGIVLILIGLKVFFKAPEQSQGTTLPQLNKLPWSNRPDFTTTLNGKVRGVPRDQVRALPAAAISMNASSSGSGRGRSSGSAVQT